MPAVLHTGPLAAILLPLSGFLLRARRCGTASVGRFSVTSARDAASTISDRGASCPARAAATSAPSTSGASLTATRARWAGVRASIAKLIVNQALPES